MSRRLSRRRPRTVPSGGGAGVFNVELWPYATGSGDAYIPLMFAAGQWPAGSVFTVTVGGTARAAGLQVTSTHGDGSLRSGTLKVAVTGSTKDSIQSGTIALGTAGPSQAYAQPTWPTAISDTLVKDVVPFHAIGMVTDATKLCASGVLGAMVAASANPAISGMTSYESVLDRCLVDVIEAQQTATIGYNATSGTSFGNANSYQYDRPALCLRAGARKANVRWWARAWQTYACIRVGGLSINAGASAFQWAEPYMGWETQTLYSNLLLGDSIALGFEIAKLQSSVYYEGYAWWTGSLDTTDSLSYARYLAHNVQRGAFYAQLGYNPTWNGRTLQTWLRDWTVRFMTNGNWSVPGSNYARYVSNFGSSYGSLMFWNSLLIYALIKVVELNVLSAGERTTVVTRIRDWMNWMWDTGWQTGSSVPVPRMQYADTGANETDDQFAPDLNGLFPHIYMWMYRENGSTVFRDRADTIIAAWPLMDTVHTFLNVSGGNPDNSSRGKVMQESYTWSQLTMGYRAGVV